MKIDRLVRVTKKRIATVHRQPSWNGSLVRKRDSQRSSSWSSIREHCPCCGTGIGAAIGGTLGLILGNLKKKKIVNDLP